MGQRLTRIYTRTGDDGSTGLGDGSRVAKDSLRVEAIGEVDELNSHVGWVLTHPAPEAVRESLSAVQHDLFDLGGELAVPGRQVMGPQQVRRLEVLLDALNADLPSLREFILPGGSPAGAACHVARAVCRRAERRLVALGRVEAVNPQTRQYLNRLSDLLFVLARVLTRYSGGGEVFWRPRGEEG
ncbi:MAG: cob(I)yrinic acid a,c-diamide adenosyltransferase [Gammaproteobacteria bacterium]|jgi:cob(I)alamin adenosyltransferase|nr:cob(I)yrinic acid a,c-diamide adenosyltransferase [Gammaproteobacteria bacterium]